MHFLILLALGTFALGSLVRHEKRSNDGTHWLPRNRALHDETVPVRVALKQKNVHLGHNALMEASDPKSPKYGRQVLSPRKGLLTYLYYSYWTVDQIDDLFSPSESSVQAVRDWLVTSGIDLARLALSRGRGSIQFNATIKELEGLLSTEYHIYEHAYTGSASISCKEYYLPSHIREHVDFITPSVGFRKLSTPAKRSRGARSSRSPSGNSASRDVAEDFSNATNLQECYLGVTPACVKALYQIPDSMPQAGNELGILNEGIPFSEGDMDGFFSRYTSIPNGTFPNQIFIDDGYNPSLEIAPETTLDLSAAYPIIYPQRIDLFIAPASGDFDDFLDAVDSVS